VKTPPRGDSLHPSPQRKQGNTGRLPGWNADSSRLRFGLASERERSSKPAAQAREYGSPSGLERGFLSLALRACIGTGTFIQARSASKGVRVAFRAGTRIPLACASGLHRNGNVHPSPQRKQGNTGRLPGWNADSSRLRFGLASERERSSKPAAQAREYGSPSGLERGFLSLALRACIGTGTFIQARSASKGIRAAFRAGTRIPLACASGLHRNGNVHPSPQRKQGNTGRLPGWNADASRLRFGLASERERSSKPAAQAREYGPAAGLERGFLSLALRACMGTGTSIQARSASKGIRAGFRAGTRIPLACASGLHGNGNVHPSPLPPPAADGPRGRAVAAALDHGAAACDSADADV
jgi:hypothetical protein